MKKAALHNLGCKVNSYELEAVGQALVHAGYELVPFEEMADVYIVNTCSVTNIADRKSRQMLHQAKKRNPQAVVVATGCYVQTGTAAILEDLSVDLLVGNNRKKDLVRLLEEFMATRDKTLGGTSVIDINATDEYEEMTLETTQEHTRAIIKIQDGCNQFCSYCIIPYARGRVRSREKGDILREVEGLAAAGFREIVVTGIHLSSYGLDFDGIKNLEKGKPFPHKHLLEVLQMLSKVSGIERIRLGSLEPRIITEEFVREIAQIKSICPHFHLSLQSGCDETLGRMNRHYSTEQYRKSVEILRTFYEHPAITTDVIVGFPGETEAEFEQTRAYLKEIGFYEMHIFPYSRRQGTVAAARKDQIADGVKKQRSAELLAMEAEDSRRYRSFYIGKDVEVLFEEEKEIDGTIYQIGHTMNYVKVVKKTAEALDGKLVRGVIRGFLSDEILEME